MTIIIAKIDFWRGGHTPFVKRPGSHVIRQKFDRCNISKSADETIGRTATVCPGPGALARTTQTLWLGDDAMRPLPAIESINQCYATPARSSVHASAVGADCGRGSSFSARLPSQCARSGSNAPSRLIRAIPGPGDTSPGPGVMSMKASPRPMSPGHPRSGGRARSCPALPTTSGRRLCMIRDRPPTLRITSGRRRRCSAGAPRVTARLMRRLALCFAGDRTPVVAVRLGPPRIRATPIR